MDNIILTEKIFHNFNLLKEQFCNSFDKIYFVDDIKKANAVFIKPNLTYPVYKKGVTTRKEFVEALVAGIKDFNSSVKIYIGEGGGGYNSFCMTKAMQDMGFYDIEKKYKNVRIVNLSEIKRGKVELRAKGSRYYIELPCLFLGEIDFSITCPVPKVHCMTKITLSLKNQWGCLPDIMRLKNHYVFDEIIGQICKKLKFKYAFLDGRYGLNKNGPMDGDPVEVDWFAASNSLGAFDVIVAYMMGFDWQEIGHLKKASQYGFIPDKKDINVIGDIENLKRKFVLKRSFWSYPALLAFYSDKLTNLFYLSKWSKLLHDIMYTFRKRIV